MRTETPVECSECGHAHYLPRRRKYAPCSGVEGCGCPLNDGANITATAAERAANGAADGCCYSCGTTDPANHSIGCYA